ncbi:MAG TPA: dephospho-CoA kinase [Planctomycetota bacterium]|nr:dephospho-CoA kinase [Planctomycetota bacterium]HJM40223.1 dephospho-CoA kinase [Planctomycetota bacterium]
MTPQNPHPGLRIVGLTGGIGSGKSTVARFLAEMLGQKTLLLDADAEVGTLLADERVSLEVANIFGERVLRPDGLLDRRIIAGLVFDDPGARVELERIIHPAVRLLLFNKLRVLEQTGLPVWAILDAPLLLESGLDQACDFLLFVEVEGAERQRRACARHGWEAEEWEARESAQIPLETKKSCADAILANTGDLEALRSALAPHLGTILSLAPRPLQERWPENGPSSQP